MKRLRVKSSFSVIYNFFRLIPNEKNTMLIALIPVFLNAAINVGNPFLIGYIIDHYIEKSQFEKVLCCSSILMVMYLIGVIASHLQNKIMGGVGHRLLFQLRQRMFQKMQNLPLSFFGENRSGDLISRFNNDTERINSFFSESFSSLAGLTATMLGTAIILLSVNFWMGLVALGPAILIFFVNRFVSPISARLNAKNLQAESDMTSEVLEGLIHFKSLIFFDQMNYMISRFLNVNHKNYSSALKIGAVNNMIYPIYGLILNIAQVGILFSGLYLMASGSLTTGILISYILNVTNFYNPLKMLAPIWNQLNASGAALDRVNFLLNYPSRETSNEYSVSSEMGIRIENVSFGYEENRPVLNDLSLYLEEGKRYAFVGPTGGGKTTLAMLIAGLYYPKTGYINIHGQNIQSLSALERSLKIGYVLQDPFFFKGTIRDNISYGNLMVKHNLPERLQNLGIMEVFKSFDNGLDTELDINGKNISAGQRQLLALIRVILRQPEILILDEPTANLDAETELEIEALLRLLPSKTISIVIAHRLHTISDADEIFFVDSGSIKKMNSYSQTIDHFISGEVK